MAQKWDEEWKSNPPDTMGVTIRPNEKLPGFALSRKEWCQLNRLRTGCGRSGAFMHKCGWRESSACECGAAVQDARHLARHCPLHKYHGDPADLFTLEADVISWIQTTNLKL